LKPRPNGDTKFKKGESGNPATMYSSEYQPSPESKSQGKKRMAEIKQTLAFLAEQLHSKQILADGQEIEVTYEGNIALQLAKQANEGKIPAIRVLAEILGWYAPTNQNIKITGNPLDNLIADKKVEVIDSLPIQSKDFKKLK